MKDLDEKLRIKEKILNMIPLNLMIYVDCLKKCVRKIQITVLLLLTQIQMVVVGAAVVEVGLPHPESQGILQKKKQKNGLWLLTAS